ncbi:hypothetical protein P7C70_g2725, partial [Phenoliferia sp. Uapishka_3]
MRVNLLLKGYTSQRLPLFLSPSLINPPKQDFSSEIMRSSSVATSLLVLAATSFAAPLAQADQAQDLTKRQYIDYGPQTPWNCSAYPSECPVNGPSGVLHYPNDGSALTTVWDNSGHIDVSYTPVNQAIGSGPAHVHTTSVIFTLREYFYGAFEFSDKIIVVGALAPPDDFSTINTRLSLPSRFYDGDNSEMNDVQLSQPGNGSVGEWAFQVIEQQSYTPDGTSGLARLIEFMSAAPLLNITYITHPDQ